MKSSSPPFTNNFGSALRPRRFKNKSVFDGTDMLQLVILTVQPSASTLRTCTRRNHNDFLCAGSDDISPIRWTPSAVGKTLQRYGTMTKPLDADVVIVGAGISGIGTAIESTGGWMHRACSTTPRGTEGSFEGTLSWPLKG